jgi:hypothetical protein
MEKLPGILRRTFLLTLGLVTPLTFALGVLSVFKVVGPLYRFRLYLRGVADGTEQEPCRIRQGDELQDFCDLLNEVTAPLRAEARERAAAAAPAPERRAA